MNECNSIYSSIAVQFVAMVMDKGMTQTLLRLAFYFVIRRLKSNCFLWTNILHFVGL